MHSRITVWTALLGASALISWMCTLYARWAVLAVIGIIFAGSILRYPTMGFVIMMGSFLIQASPAYQQYGFLASSYTATDLIGLLVVSGLLVQRLSAGRNHAKRTWTTMHKRLVFAVGAYFGWSIIAFAWSPVATSVASQYIRHAVENLFVFGLALLMLNTRQAVRRAAGIYAVAGTSLAVYTVVTFQQLQGFGATSNTFVGQAIYRSGGIGAYNENFLAVMIAIVPALAYIATEGSSLRYRLLFTGISIPPVGLALIILTSRESFIAIIVATAAAFVLSRNMRYRLGVVILMAVAGATFLIASQTNHIPWYFSQRFSAASYDNLGSRLPGWQVGIQLFEQNPLAGTGNGGFETYVTSYHVGYAVVTSPHSDYIGTVADLGLVGFILLLTMMTVVGSTTVFRAGRHPAAVIIFFTLAISMAAGSILEEHWLWVAFGIVCAFGLTSSVVTETSSESVENRRAARPGVLSPAATIART